MNSYVTNSSELNVSLELQYNVGSWHKKPSPRGTETVIQQKYSELKINTPCQ